MGGRRGRGGETALEPPPPGRGRGARTCSSRPCPGRRAPSRAGTQRFRVFCLLREFPFSYRPARPSAARSPQTPRASPLSPQPPAQHSLAEPLTACPCRRPPRPPQGHPERQQADAGSGGRGARGRTPPSPAGASGCAAVFAFLIFRFHRMLLFAARLPPALSAASRALGQRDARVTAEVPPAGSCERDGRAGGRGPAPHRPFVASRRRRAAAAPASGQSCLRGAGSCLRA